MPTPPAIAPFAPTYSTRVPYLTRSEFLAEPTGIDAASLIPGADAATNGAALDRLLADASSYADVICHQVLAATLDTQVGVYRCQGDGTIHVPFDYTPVIEINAVHAGGTPTSLAAAGDLSGIWWGSRKVAWIPVAGFRAGCRVFATVSYVNGYANTALAAPASAGDTEITVETPLGIVPGMTFWIYDDTLAASELVTVSATYSTGQAVVPLTAALAYDHTTAAVASAMPRAVKQAVTALCSHLVKTRGAEAMVMGSLTGGPAQLDQAAPGYTEEYAQAVDLLGDFRRTR